LPISGPAVVRAAGPFLFLPVEGLRGFGGYDPMARLACRNADRGFGLDGSPARGKLALLLVLAAGFSSAVYGRKTLKSLWDDRSGEIILDSIADGVFTVDENWLITGFNRAAERITGVPREEAVGRRCCEVFHASICETGCALRRTMATGKPIVNLPVFIVNAEGRRIPISISTAILRDEEGRIVGGVETFRDLSVEEELRKEISKLNTFEDIVSKSHRMRDIFRILPDMAESDATVLIEGETGTGKELIARALHNLSTRREGPLVVVNCAGLPDTLLESELFGYKAGAFTDARKDKPGRFAVADGGTVFLDEIGDISSALQPKLLRFLQEKTYEPLGSSETLKADVRVVAATNKSLQNLVTGGEFREDLYYRLNVLRITLPPLRERKEDIPLLVDNFIMRFNKLRGKEILGVSPEVLSLLMEYDYPGNIREIENIIEHAFVLCRSAMIGVEHLPDYLRPKLQQPGGFAAKTLDELEALHISQALKRNEFNRRATADELGIDKTTLWRKIKKYGIEIPGKAGAPPKKSP